MSYPMRRYLFDPTGISPNNFVSGERHLLGPRTGPYHPVAPLYGPFYYNEGTFKVYCDGQILTPGIDYHATTLIQEPTALTGMEVCEVLLLRGRTEGQEIVIDYQNVGGQWQSNASGIVDMYNAYLADNRPIDWTNIRNKPTTGYPPAYHLHLLKDVVGWDSIIVAIERLINVLTLRNVPAFEALIDWVQARSVDFCTEAEVLDIVHADKAVSLRRLILAAQKLNFNTVIFTPREYYRKPPEMFVVDLHFTHFEENEMVYWDIFHNDTFPDMFKQDKGALRVSNKKARFIIQTVEQPGSKGMYPFVVRLRRNSSSGPVLAISPTLTLVHSKEWDLDYGALNNGIWSIPTTLHNGLVWATPESQFLISDDYFFNTINK